ncbi:hypothetical protein V6N11_017783 [Hibiscus sabdariffa]|uniref:Uncharacterized protein n=1 Tax=Hibiscus sabdariffa TaxID=183260 RepID=A0ABR2TZ28_9ROSI
MASKSFLNQLNDLDFTNEEQGAIFIPAIPWDSVTEDSHLTIIDVAAVNTPNRCIPRADNVPTDSIQDKHPSMAAATEPGVTTKALSVADIAPVGAKLANAAMMETLYHTKGNDPDPILVSTPPVDVNNKAQIDKVLESSTNDSLGSTMVPTLKNLEDTKGFIDFLNTTNETSSEVPYLLDNVGMDAGPNTLLPIPREGGLEYDLGKSFIATSNMLDIFDAWISNQSFPHTTKIDEESPLLIPCGTKRRLSMPNDSKFKKARLPPIISKTRAGMSSVKNSSAEVISQPRRGKWNFYAGTVKVWVRPRQFRC